MENFSESDVAFVDLCTALGGVPLPWLVRMHSLPLYQWYFSVNRTRAEKNNLLLLLRAATMRSSGNESELFEKRINGLTAG